MLLLSLSFALLTEMTVKKYSSPGTGKLVQDASKTVPASVLETSINGGEAIPCEHNTLKLDTTFSFLLGIVQIAVIEVKFDASSVSSTGAGSII